MIDQERFNSLEEIITYIENQKNPEFDWMTWVGKNYSKGALLRDLKNVCDGVV